MAKYYKKWVHNCLPDMVAVQYTDMAHFVFIINDKTHGSYGSIPIDIFNRTLVQHYTFSKEDSLFVDPTTGNNKESATISEFWHRDNPDSRAFQVGPDCFILMTKGKPPEKVVASYFETQRQKWMYSSRAILC